MLLGAQTTLLMMSLWSIERDIKAAHVAAQRARQDAAQVDMAAALEVMRHVIRVEHDLAPGDVEHVLMAGNSAFSVTR
jgi:hypothetical protein